MNKYKVMDLIESPITYIELAQYDAIVDASPITSQYLLI